HWGSDHVERAERAGLVPSHLTTARGIAPLLMYLWFSSIYGKRCSGTAGTTAWLWFKAKYNNAASITTTAMMRATGLLRAPISIPFWMQHASTTSNTR